MRPSTPTYNQRCLRLIDRHRRQISGAIAIIAAGAAYGVSPAGHITAAKWLNNYSQLQNPSLFQVDHVFVIGSRIEDNGSDSAPAAPCEQGWAASPEAIVVDPTASLSLDQVLQDAPAAHTVYLSAGVFHLDRSLVIADRAEPLTLRACPGQTALIDNAADAPAVVVRDSRQVRLTELAFVGSAPVQIVLERTEDSVVENNLFRRVKAGIMLDRSRRNQLLRNVFSDVATTAIELKDGSDGNLIAGNVIDGANAPETSGGGIFLHGTSDNRIAHNFVQHTAGFGIGILNWDADTLNRGNVVEYNLLRRTVLGSTDSGAIYVLGRSAIDTGVVIAGNVVDGFGSPGNHNVGIYLDDSTSGASVIGNLVRGAGSDAIQIHGGQDNLITDNLIDLGATDAPAVLFQAAPADTNPPNLQTGNRVERNVVVSSNPAPRPFTSYDGGTPFVSGNFHVFGPGASPIPDPAVPEIEPRFADPALLSTTPRDDYRSIQAEAARQIGFRPIDPAAAGVRRKRAR